jgi:hypothetical protein
MIRAPDARAVGTAPVHPRIDVAVNFFVFENDSHARHLAIVKLLREERRG